jgi:hypothetical protein
MKLACNKWISGLESNQIVAGNGSMGRPDHSTKEDWLMANLGKHKRNLVSEFLGGDEAAEPAQSRSVHLTVVAGKAAKGAVRRVRPFVSNGQAQRPDVALIREPALPSRMDDKTSQASSPEHLRKLQRLPKLRAPYQNSGRRAG